MLMAVITQVMINYKITATEEFEPRRMELNMYKDSLTYLADSLKDPEASFREVMKGYKVEGSFENLTEQIVNYGKDHLSEYRSQMIVAAEFHVSVVSIAIDCLTVWPD